MNSIVYFGRELYNNYELIFYLTFYVEPEVKIVMGKKPIWLMSRVEYVDDCNYITEHLHC